MGYCEYRGNEEVKPCQIGEIGSSSCSVAQGDNGANPSLRRRRPGWKLEARTCAACFKEFRRKKRGNDAGLCCSRECGFTLIRWRGEQSRQYVLARNELRRWGARVRRSRITTLRKARSKLLGSIIMFCRTRRPCADCGAALGRTRLQMKCCFACARLRERNSPSRRADKARRKAMQRGRVVGSERFDPLEILARDGWRCHMCGISTPKRLRGTYNDRAPELDHITPLALGGEHSRLNTACACRKCNGTKADRPLGQLRLVA